MTTVSIYTDEGSPYEGITAKNAEALLKRLYPFLTFHSNLSFIDASVGGKLGYSVLIVTDELLDDAQVRRAATRAS
jgi:hypothetical protein